jgi:hypothetical protein
LQQNCVTEEVVSGQWSVGSGEKRDAHCGLRLTLPPAKARSAFLR